IPGLQISVHRFRTFLTTRPASRIRSISWGDFKVTAIPNQPVTSRELKTNRKVYQADSSAPNRESLKLIKAMMIVLAEEGRLVLPDRRAPSPPRMTVTRSEYHGFWGPCQTHRCPGSLDNSA